MRTIKFRGFTIDLEVNRWIYGYLIDYDKIQSYKNLETIRTDSTVAIESIGQFTGMYDSFRKEIYEGDIIRQTDGDITTDFLVVYNGKEGKFQKQSENKNSKISLLDFRMEDFENYEIKVIDNIYNLWKKK
jgi:putative prophage lp2 protein 26|nr:MAG TPA: YopX protein [Caudoviricetes sp.]